MSQSTIDIVVRTRGERELEKLQTNMKRLQGEATRLQGTLPAAANGIRQTGRAAATATGNVQRFGIAFRSTVAPIVAAYGAINFFNRSLSVMADRERDVEILANGLRNVGAQAGQLERLQRIASRLGEQTLFNQEDFTQGFALLTSFRNIGVSSYERVSQAAADMATVTRTGVRESLLQLSKALENPVEGMSALSRSGTTFTAAQKAVVKSLVESNRQLEAQEYLLRIVEGQYKGASTEAAKGFAGQMDTLNETFRDFQEVVGKGVLPIVTELVKGMTDTFRVLSELDPQLLTAAGNAAVLAAKLLLVNKAIKAMLGFKAAIATMLTGTARNMTLTGVAAGRATPLIKAMATALRNLAAIGIVTVGVDYIVNGFGQRGAESAERGRLQRELAGGSTQVFAGASRESVQEVRRQAQETIRAADEELERGRSVLGRTAQTLIPDFARYLFGQAGGLTRTRENILEGRRAVAQQRLQQLDPSQFQTEAQLLQGTTPGPELPTPDSDSSSSSSAAKQLDNGAELLRQLQQSTALTETKSELDKEILGISQKYQDTLLDISKFEDQSLRAQLEQAALRQRNAEIDEAVVEHEEELAKLRKDSVSDITEEIAHLQAKLAGKEDEYLIEKRIADLRKSSQGTLSQEDAAAYVAQADALRKQAEAADKLKQEYEGLASSISGQLTGAFRSLIDGSKSAEQALSDAFRGIADAFLDMAMKMIQEWLKMQLLGIFAGGLGGSRMDLSGTTTTNVPVDQMPAGMAFADGGYPPVGQASLVGERGPELFIPGQQGLVVPNDIFDATRQALNSRGETDQAFSENSEALAVATSYTRERMFERERQTMLTGAGGSTTVQTQVINNVEYATIDQVQEVANLSAKKARAQVFSDMRNRPSTRASLGMG